MGAVGLIGVLTTLTALTALAEGTAAGPEQAMVAAGGRIVKEGTPGGAAACLACHGADGAGNAAAGFPRLTQLEPAYMVRQMQAYKAGLRDDPVMGGVARVMSEEEMRAAAAWYGAQQPGPPTAPAQADEALVTRGADIALHGRWGRTIPACVQCHGPEGQGIGPNFPALAGQHATYIATQLHRWKEGKRKGDPNGLMRVVAERMTDEEIAAVAAYFASLPSVETR